MSIFRHSSYKQILRERLEHLKARNRHYNFREMAERCQIQKTYLSRALHQPKTHLSPDQLFLAIDYLGFSADERQFICKLYDLERAQVSARKQQLERELDILRKQRLKTESHISASSQSLSQEEWNRYYLEPDLQVIHMFMTVPRFARNPELARKVLGLSNGIFSEALKTLMNLKILSLTENGYLVTKEKIHLSSGSPIYGTYKQLLRIRALEQMRKLKPDQRYIFSVIFSAGKRERTAIQEEFFRFLRKVEKIVAAATPNEVYQMNFDLLDWISDGAENGI